MSMATKCELCGSVFEFTKSDVVISGVVTTPPMTVSYVPCPRCKIRNVFTYVKED